VVSFTSWSLYPRYSLGSRLGVPRSGLDAVANRKSPCPCICDINQNQYVENLLRVNVGGPSEKFVDWREGAAIMQREMVTVMPSCSGGGNVVVA
jgi:hypothetical protein